MRRPASVAVASTPDRNGAYGVHGAHGARGHLGDHNRGHGCQGTQPFEEHTQFLITCVVFSVLIALTMLFDMLKEITLDAVQPALVPIVVQSTR